MTNNSVVREGRLDADHDHDRLALLEFHLAVLVSMRLRGGERSSPSNCQENPTSAKESEVVPSHRIKGLGDIQLEEKGWSSIFVEVSCCVPNGQKIIMDTSLLNKSALIR